MSSGGDVRARRYLAALCLFGAGVVAVELGLITGGHLLAAQIVDAALVLAVMNMGPRDESQLSGQAVKALAALRALALVPLIRVVALALPMRDWSDAAAVMVIALSIGLAAVRLAPFVGVPRGRLFAVRIALSHLYAATAGATLGLLAYFVGAPPLWPDGAKSEIVAVAVAAAGMAAVTEELVFRGVLQVTFQQAAGALGVLGASAIFAATYLDAGSPALVLTYSLAGLVFAHSVGRTAALGGAIIGHVLLAVGAGAIWPVLLGRTSPLDLPESRTTVVLGVAVVIAAAVAFRQPMSHGPPDDQTGASAHSGGGPISKGRITAG